MNKCCKDMGNRTVLEVQESVVSSNNGQYKAITKIEKCNICGRKHYHMDAEPLDLKMKTDG
jgi:hypothetical protein